MRTASITGSAIIAAAMLLHAGPAIAQERGLGRFLDALGKVGVRVAPPTGTGQTATAPSVPPAMNEPTAEQQATQASMVAASVSAQIDADRAEAKALIERIVTISSCATNGSAWNRLNRQHERPGTWSEHYSQQWVPISRTNYHPKMQCLDVMRLSNWEKPARNALNFRVEMISAHSDEVARQDFQLIRGANGEWIIRSIGQASF